ncbi:hypothetical protein GGI12_005000 [Dipsacomyces acuminosporus]|nr:hypothetical protein GGI12_005000 [Dipsacomyces acuminosporus]
MPVVDGSDSSAPLLCAGTGSIVGAGNDTAPISNSSWIDPLAILGTTGLPSARADLTSSAIRHMRPFLGFADNLPQLLGSAEQSQAPIDRLEQLLSTGPSSSNPGLLAPCTTEPLDSFCQALNLERAGDSSSNSNTRPAAAEARTDRVIVSSNAASEREPSVESLLSSTAMDVPQTLVDVAERHSLNEDPQTLLLLLRLAFVNADMIIRTPEFWTMLEAGNASDFVVLAHLAIATREAYLSKTAIQVAPERLADLESTCFEAAKKEWYDCKATNSTGAVFALHMLSEYAYHTGLYTTMWDFAQYAIDAAKGTEFRNTRCPWKGAKNDECDLEYEHLAMCFWRTWCRLFMAAQRMNTRIHLVDSKDLPEYPDHPCYSTAQTFAKKGVTKQDCVEFAHMACIHNGCSLQSASARNWHSLAPMHNRYIGLLEGKVSLHIYLDDLKTWRRKMQSERSAWPEAWALQAQAMFNKAHRVNKEKFNGEVPLNNSICSLGSAADTSVAIPGAGTHALASPEASPATTAADTAHTRRNSEDPSATNKSRPEVSSDEIKAGLWVVIMYTIYEMSRLRAHYIALAYMSEDRSQFLHEEGSALPVFTTISLPSVPDGYRYISDDAMGDSIAFHQSKSECMDAANNLQSLFNMADLLGYPLEVIGVWIVFIFEHLISIQCGRMASKSWSTKVDALKRLARLLRQLLARKKWTCALHVFATFVQTYMGSKNTISGGEAIASENARLVELSPWPQNHVLSILMRLMDMNYAEFCAYTIPLAIASKYAADALPPTDITGLSL